MKKNFKFLATLLLLIIYFFGVRPILGSANASPIEMIVLGGLTLVYGGPGAAVVQDQSISVK